MKLAVTEVERFRSMHAWVNRVLRIDLSTMRVEVHEAGPYVPEYLGGRGIATRICYIPTKDGGGNLVDRPAGWFLVFSILLYFQMACLIASGRYYESSWAFRIWR